MKKLLLLFFALLCLTGTAKAATAELSFDELYSGGGVLGLQFSDKVKNLAGQRITIKGFMAPPLKAEAAFFVLTREPVALCPFCQSDADWPDNILVVYLSSSQSFVQNNTTIEVEGVLEIGSHRDGDTGFISQLRLRVAVRRHEAVHAAPAPAAGRPLPHAVTADPSKDLV